MSMTQIRKQESINIIQFFAKIDLNLDNTKVHEIHFASPHDCFGIF